MMVPTKAGYAATTEEEDEYEIVEIDEDEYVGGIPTDDSKVHPHLFSPLNCQYMTPSSVLSPTSVPSFFFHDFAP